MCTKYNAYRVSNLMFAEYEERVRRRRERSRDFAERRAAKAAALEAIMAALRDREELVAKLEEEKENLENLLAEWEERQVKEVSQLWKAKEGTNLRILSWDGTRFQMANNSNYLVMLSLNSVLM